jgi:hypothetical protein
MKTICAIGAVLVGACISATVTAAAPIGGAIGGRSSEGLVTKTATYVCTRDDRGWHYMRGERRVTCRPVRPKGAFWGWRCEGPRCGWWHRNDRRWHDAG